MTFDNKVGQTNNPLSRVREHPEPRKRTSAKKLVNKSSTYVESSTVPNPIQEVKTTTPLTIEITRTYVVTTTLVVDEDLRSINHLKMKIASASELQSHTVIDTLREALEPLGCNERVYGTTDRTKVELL